MVRQKVPHWCPTKDGPQQLLGVIVLLSIQVEPTGSFNIPLLQSMNEDGLLLPLTFVQ